jgi:hypothetical protein
LPSADEPKPGSFTAIAEDGTVDDRGAITQIYDSVQRELGNAEPCGALEVVAADLVLTYQLHETPPDGLISRSLQ